MITKSGLSSRKYQPLSRRRLKAKRFENPLFPRKKRKTRQIEVNIPRRLKIVLLALLVLFIGGGWFLVYSEFFRIKTISAAGEGRIDPLVLENLAWEQANSTFIVLWPQNNIFIYDTDRLKERLESKYAFAALEIAKKFPRSLEIGFREKSYALIWRENDKYFFADEHGDVITETNPAEIGEKDYPLVESRSGLMMDANRLPLDDQYLSFLLRLYPAFKAYADELPLDRFLADQELNTLKLTLVNGPQLYFDTTENLEKQIDKLLIIKNEKIKNDFFKKTYIDLRYGDRVYYR